MDAEKPGTEGSTSEGPKPTFLARLHFIWFVIVGALWTVPMSFLMAGTHQIWPTIRNFKRVSGLWGRVILAASGIRVEVTDRAGLDPDGPYVFVSNHQNLLDILALCAAVPYYFSFVAKEELSRVPIFGIAIRNSGLVLIKRSDPRSALKSLQEAGERIRGGNSVLVFAEGTRSYSRDLQELKKGAFAIAVEAGVPMIPVTILDAYERMNEKARLVNGGTMHIVIGEPISLEGKTRRDIPLLMELTRERLSTQLAEADIDATRSNKDILCL